MKKDLLERFLRYVKINTRSDENSDSFPSTPVQFDLAKVLVKELREMGLDNANVDEYCYVTATLPSNVGESLPKIGLIAHLDTSPEVTGENVNPVVIEIYSGGDVIVNKEIDFTIKESENEDLKKCIGHTLVTTDGTTLLGADDKAGIAAIMTAIRYFTQNRSIPHCEIKVVFTPDEEVARGVEKIDLAKIGADFAYTVDGGAEGELNMETFSADAALIEVEGRDIHPGKAKGIMVNSIRVVSEIVARLPKSMTPEKTDGYEPYIHPVSMDCSVLKSSLKLILRDFITEGLGRQKQLLGEIIKDVERIYPDAKIKLEITEQYRNMLDELKRHPEVTGRLFTAAKKAGLNPEWKPIRGGTDGSRLTAMGLPTPNIFTGGSNAHSRTEWLSIDALAKAVETIVFVARCDL